MREVKFRTWQRNLKEMHDVLAIDWESGWIKTEVGKNMWNLGAYDLMQYTGLLDKNGKEIYEGDIFRASSEHGRVCCFTGIVEWENDIYGDIISGFNLGDHIEIELIGNIYENPELIK